MPLGVLPRGFPQAAAEALVELDYSSTFRLERSIRHALQMPSDEVEARAASYRSAMKMSRNPALLNRKLDAFLHTAVTV